MALKKYQSSNNLLPTPTAPKTEIVSGITFKLDKNGVCTISGTASAAVTFSYDLSEIYSVPTSKSQGGNAYLYFWNSATTNGTVRFFYNDTQRDYWSLGTLNRVLTAFDSLENQTINRIEIRIPSGTSYNGTIAPMITNNGNQATAFEPCTGWVHSLRKLTTATEAVENPLYSDGTAITAYTLKGNEEHTGTPSPQNPVMPNGVGDKTANLFDYQTMSSGELNKFLNADGSLTNNNSWSTTDYIPVNGTEFTLKRTATGNSPAICLYDSDKQYITGLSYEGNSVVTISALTGAHYARFSYQTFSGTMENLSQTMLTKGSTVPSSYIPYGYKIPISSGSVTTPIYLTEQLMKVGEATDSLESSGTVIRPISKFEFTGNEIWGGGDKLGSCYRYILGFYDGEPLTETVSTHFKWGGYAAEGNDGEITGAHNSSTLYRMYFWSATIDSVSGFRQFLAQQYANGTPVTVYYVLPTPTTETVTAPSIPTTDGANSITVGTTVQPSEFTATWTGWHDATVKEWDGSDWQ